MSTPRKPTILRLSEQDLEIIRLLKDYYGISSQNEVIRMALRAALRELPSTPAPISEITEGYSRRKGLGIPPHG